MVIDGLCGVGGNTIQFAKKLKTCVAIDIDEQRVQHCLHNAAIYNCQDSVVGITADFTNIKPGDIPNYVDEPK